MSQKSLKHKKISATMNRCITGFSTLLGQMEVWYVLGHPTFIYLIAQFD